VSALPTSLFGFACPYIQRERAPPQKPLCFSSRDVRWQRALEEFRQFDWPATLNRFAVAFSWNSVTALPVTSLIVLVFWLPFCPEFQSVLGTKLRDWDNRIFF
jgi:hypothetical protein